MSTSECSCRLWPTPGMYVVTSIPLVRRTRATFRSAELGFLGVCVNTRTHTPRFCGLSCSAGLFVFVTTFSRPLRTSWLIVGTVTPQGDRPPNSKQARQPRRQHFSMRRARSVGCSKPREPRGGPAPEADLPYWLKLHAPARMRRAARINEGACLEFGSR